MGLELGKKVAMLRKRNNNTQAQLAEYLAVHPQTVSRWEAEGGMPDVTLLPKIALFFGISLDELFGMTDMEQIDNLVYKYSVLRDEKSFEEVTRSIGLALESLDETEVEKRNQLLAWKVHVYIQKSRQAQQEAEQMLDELLLKVGEKTNGLYWPLRLQKQQFRIQKGKGREALQDALSAWENEPTLEHLHLLFAALTELDKGEELLSLWEQKEVRRLVEKVTEETAPLWLMAFQGAAREKKLQFFTEHMELFQKSADALSCFSAEWSLAELYAALQMDDEKEKIKKILTERLETLHMNEYLKMHYAEKIKLNSFNF